MPGLLQPSIGCVLFARLLKSKTPASIKIIVVVIVGCTIIVG
jgi:hypothetical protein